MRRFALLAAFMLLLTGLTGCLSGGDDANDDDGMPNGEDPDGDEPGSPSDGANDRGMQRPTLSPGIAWTYETSGTQAANETLTLVTASSNLSGYLFAGANRSDLLGEIAWDQPWLGPLNRDLNPVNESGEEKATLFAFPITDGKTWMDRGATVTAEKTTLETTFGPLDGYRMTAQGPDANRTWTIARDTGYLASYTATDADTTLLSLELTQIETTNQATWYTQHGRLSINGTFVVNQLTVPPEATHLVVGAHLYPSGQATMTPPPDAMMEPWQEAATEDERWVYAALPGAEGSWTSSLSGNPTTPSQLRATAIAVTPLTPTGP